MSVFVCMRVCLCVCVCVFACVFACAYTCVCLCLCSVRLVSAGISTGANPSGGVARRQQLTTADHFCRRKQMLTLQTNIDRKAGILGNANKSLAIEPERIFGSIFWPILEMPIYASQHSVHQFLKKP